MSRVGRVAFAGIAGALAIAALVAMVVTVGGPRPVDVRQVDLSPAQPGVLSATYSTTVQVVPPTPVLVAPPPREAVPPSRATTEPPAAPPHSEPAPPPAPTTSADRRDPGRCEFGRFPDGLCVPWRFPPSTRELCTWLRAHGLPDIQFRDRSGREVDFDGRLCGD
ncbi:hypothetical protein [Actinosynnema sp. NPDC023587]|uniref:hypothetical protein n=1 Tax=Actinosynnema sp. NPDC023587 TaxID=3154695 RepID=UPI0033ED4FA2